MSDNISNMDNAKQFIDTLERVFLTACSPRTECMHGFHSTSESRIFYSSFVYETVTPPEESLHLEKGQTSTEIVEEGTQPTLTQDEDIPFVIIRRPRHDIQGFGDTESITSTLQIPESTSSHHKRVNEYNTLYGETVAPRIQSVVDQLQVLDDNLRKIEAVVDNPSFVYLAQQKNCDPCYNSEQNKGDDLVSDAVNTSAVYNATNTEQGRPITENKLCVGNPNQPKLKKFLSFSNEAERDRLFSNHELWKLQEFIDTIEVIGDNINIVDKETKGKEKILMADVTDLANANLDNSVEVWYMQGPTTCEGKEKINLICENASSEVEEVDTESRIAEDLLVKESVWGTRINQFVERIPSIITAERVESTTQVAQNVITAGICVIGVMCVIDRIRS